MNGRTHIKTQKIAILVKKTLKTNMLQTKIS